MNIQSLIKEMTNSGIEANEAKCEIKMLLEHFCSYTEKDKANGIKLSEEQFELLQEKVTERIATKMPIQYIIGKAWFMEHFYKVNSDVLIPRDETELLVQKTLEIIKINNFTKILDIGTGSGCIACTIAKNTNAIVLGTDISSDALIIALNNATELNLNNKAIFRKSDIFEKIHTGERFDVIVSNPPYIKKGTVLDKEVMFEPKIALFANNDGYEFYIKIIKDACKYLTDGGYLLFELGFGEAEQVKKLMDKNFCEIQIVKDFAGIERVIIGKRKPIIN